MIELQRLAARGVRTTVPFDSNTEVLTALLVASVDAVFVPTPQEIVAQLDSGAIGTLVASPAATELAARDTDAGRTGPSDAAPVRFVDGARGARRTAGADAGDP